jgi:drug/metabolite transporter (DMT)-like permease
MAITVPLGVPLFAIACLLFGAGPSLQQFTLPAWIWLSLAGIVHFVIGRYGNYRATRALGASLSSPIQQFSVPVALILAVVLLDEVLTPLRLVGVMLVMVGAYIAVQPRKKNPLRSDDAKKTSFVPDYPNGLFWGGVCALAYGTSPLLVVEGLGASRTMIDSLAGGLISYSAAAAVITVPIMLAGGIPFLKQVDPTAARWFAISGAIVFLSQVLRYMALVVAPVAVVVPIQRLSVVFRVVFSWVMNREHEIIDARVIIGIALSLVGAVALTLSTDLLASVLPANLATLVNAQWP